MMGTLNNDSLFNRSKCQILVSNQLETVLKHQKVIIEPVCDGTPNLYDLKYRSYEYGCGKGMVQGEGVVGSI